MVSAMNIAARPPTAKAAWGCAGRPSRSLFRRHAYFRPHSRREHSRVYAVLKTQDAEILGDVPQVEVKLTAEVVRSISAVGRNEWNACATASGEVNPFLLWEFFHAVEESQSAVKEQGWLPQHVVVRSEDGRKLLGCCPLYLKGHSYGEYVFDHSWANAASRMGVSYYPKLQSCVPFTPVTGARLLVSPGPQAAAVRKALAETLVSVTDTLQVSSLHLTFNTEEEWTLMRTLGFLPRMGIQYHWENNAYGSFDDYLMALRQSKRKNIRQERKSIAAQGLRVDRLRGDELKPHHWDAFYKFYINTTDRKWGSAYLTREFFHMLGDALGDKVMLMVARDAGAGELTAGALNLVGSHAIFGRNWGCQRGRKYKNLHFELCYYQALEAAIELGLERVEAGAQGEHKIQRGYLANFTYSSHYIRNSQLSNMVARYLYQERSEIEYTLESINAMASPYKS